MNEYMESITRLGNEVLFFLFKTSVILITILLIVSLILLIIGCIVRSQKLRSKYLKVSIFSLLSLIVLLIMPVLAVYIRVWYSLSITWLFK